MIFIIDIKSEIIFSVILSKGWFIDENCDLEYKFSKTKIGSGYKIYQRSKN